MVTPEIINYIKQQTAAGVSREQISVNLKQNGWNDLDIAEAFNALNATIPPTPPVILPAQAHGHTLRNLFIVIIFLLLAAGGGYWFFLKANNKTDTSATSLPDIETQTNADKQAPKDEVIDFDSLKTTYTIVPATENSASIFNMIPKNVVDQTDSDVVLKYLNDNSLNQPIPTTEFKKIIGKYKNVLASFDAGTNKKYYQCSLAVGENCPLNNLRDSAYIATVNSLVLFSGGKVNDAQNYAQKIIKLGQMVTAQSDDMINMLIGWVIQKTGYSTLTKIKINTKLSNDDKVVLIKNLRDEQKEVIKLIYTRYVNFIDYITDPNKKPSLVLSKADEEGVIEYRKIKNDFNWNPNETKKWYFDSAKIELANIDLPCGSEYKESTIDIGFDPNKSDAEIKSTANYIGKIMYSVNYASLGAANKKRCGVESIINSF